MKLESVNSSLFKLGGVTYTKGDYVPVWKNLNYTNDVVDNDKSVPTVNIINKNTNLGIFTDYVSHTRFVDSTGTPYADVATFALALATTISGNATSVGPTGPTGPQGPVGPAGLTWRGAWVSGTSYVVNDAVGYSGASYFCIANTSGTTTPNLATTAWALLASQGAVGPAGATGATGATGAQGPTGPAGPGTVGTYGSTTATATVPYPVLLNSINNVLNLDATATRKVRLNENAPVGTKVIAITSSPYSAVIKAASTGGQIYINGIGGTPVDEVIINENQEIHFTSLSQGQWLCEFVQPKQILEYIGQVYQTGTSAPSLQTPIMDTLSVNQYGLDAFRKVEFTRLGTGIYNLSVKWKNVPTSQYNIGVMFGDGICRVGTRSDGSSSGVFFSTFEVRTYTPAGVLSDGLLVGTNAACFSVKLYPYN
jgi:hypothetical protein